MKKYIIKAMTALAFASFLTGCSDFGDVNIDPEHPNSGNMDIGLEFSNAQHQALGSDWDVWRTGLAYTSQFMQQLSGLTNFAGYAFYTWSDSYSAAYWDGVTNGSRAAAYHVTDALRKWKDDPARTLDYAIARVMRVYIYQRLSDLYGDVQYTQGGQPDLYSYPKYDKQEDVYNDFLKELDEAQATLKAGGTASLEKQDLYFQGDAKKWYQFANSLMLRVAMRLSKVDAAKAQEYAKKAYDNGGLITDNADNVMLLHSDGDPNNDSAEPYAKILCHSDPGEFFICDQFMNMLKRTNDPRIPMIATVCAEDPMYGYTDSKYTTGNSDPAIQKGLPMGYTITKDSEWDIRKAHPEVSLDKGIKDGSYKFKLEYSTVNRLTYSDPKAPTMIVTAGETLLLMAEAAHRGWIPGNAADYYNKGVRAAMTQFTAYPNAKALYQEYMTDAAINAYLAANPFDPSKALEQINTQYYIATFCDAYETFANWRRSGYPKLNPINPAKPYPNSVTQGKSIPRRFTYPIDESTVNKANYEEAVQRLSDGDTFLSRVWWDKE